ncbi:helicase protein MOM1-like, partial [Trifolium medium]|nr:helicase protein MOM1-like [Trifolium medium]
SKFKKITVLRLYSCFTVEEKVLMLAKEGIALVSNKRKKELDSTMQLINQSTYHTLLKWGASYLFSKLDDLHGSGTSVSASDISNQSNLNDVICELSSKLVCDSGGTDSHRQSFISRVEQNGEEYARNISLLGEREMKKLGNETHTFSWSDLLKGRNPRWKFLSASSQRNRKTVEYFHHTVKGSENENDAIIRKKRTKSTDGVYPIGKNASKDNVDPEERKITKDNV